MISSSSENESKLKCYIFMQSYGMQQGKEVPTWKFCCVCVCVGLQDKIHMFREYFLRFTTSKSTEKVELTKKAADKTSTILCRRYNNCLDSANLYSPTIKQVLKLVRFKDLE